MADVLTETLPVLPLTGGVILPQMVVTVGLETDEARAAVDAAGDDGRLLLLPRIDGAYARVGTVATVESRGELPNGSAALLVRAGERALVGTGVVGTSDALYVEATVLEPDEPTDATHELARELRATLRSVFEHLGGARLSEVLRGVDDPAQLADLAGYWPDLSTTRKVELLETVRLDTRLELVLEWAKETLAELELAEKIRTDVSEGMERQQREFLLRQQMEAIRRELGESGDEADVVAEFRQRLDGLTLPEPAREHIAREIDRLERSSPQQMEHGWIRTWLETVFEVPWGCHSSDDLDLDHARATLDADHHGLVDVKQRIVEYLAVRKLRADRGLGAADDRKAGAIITLVGPPGVGKTSLGQSVADALGRDFVRVALGGVRDESEIRGHRRTYVGAQPGRVVRALTEADSMNPVFLLDEIDKVGADWRGDPSSALLEVLDPAQNHRFRDHYLEVDLDLSDVLFIATANVLDTIPAPLLDRMEVVHLDGYTDDEKVAIGRDHLLPRQLERNGLLEGEVELDDAVLRAIVRGYTREAGVRSLERRIATLLRKAATEIARGAEAPVAIGTGDLDELLGRPPFHDEVAERVGVPGVATGLAVTGAGGDVLFVESTSMEGEPGLVLTGQLGEVMKESGQIALSHLRANRDRLGIGDGIDTRRVHVHFPAGAVPKDGPSAGITMTTALASLFSDRAVRPTVGMTGEITLQGKVLPIGGVKQKVLAAHRAGLTDVILPRRNEKDLDDVPDAVRDDLTIHLVDSIDEVLDLALEEPRVVGRTRSEPSHPRPHADTRVQNGKGDPPRVPARAGRSSEPRGRGSADVIATQASAAWGAAVCWDDEYAVERLAEVRAV